MATSDRHTDSEDMFAETRMSFGEHLEDLRKHLWRAIAGFLVALFLSFFIARPVLHFIAKPVEDQLAAFFDERVVKVEEELNEGSAQLEKINAPIDITISFDAAELTRQLNPNAPIVAKEGDRVELTARINEPLRFAIKMQHAQQIVSRRPTLSTLGIQEAFMAWFKVAIGCGIVIGSPWIFYQIWLFIAAGLYPHEKRYVNVFMPFSLALFIAGILVCQFLVIPKAIEALLWFNQWVGLEPDLRFNEWLGFAIMMPLVFGVSFQLPLVMLFLERIGIMTIEGYLNKWRIALMLIEIFAAVITPSVDVVSMQCLALPMFGLYGLGIALCYFRPKQPDLDIEVPDSEEMVEV